MDAALTPRGGEVFAGEVRGLRTRDGVDLFGRAADRGDGAGEARSEGIADPLPLRVGQGRAYGVLSGRRRRGLGEADDSPPRPVLMRRRSAVAGRTIASISATLGQNLHLRIAVRSVSTHPIEPGEAVAAFEGWHPAVIEMVAQHLSVRWGLFGTRPLLRWYRGGVVLLGDAAHAMLPHHGQGANTSIEDAITLAELLPGTAPEELASLLSKYQSLRRARTRKIQRSSWITNALLHLPDSSQLAERDRRVARFPEDFAWIHQFDALQTARNAMQTQLHSAPPDA
jgi:2-polyprenyl-6-methoxyphenol hydroxylase-like FAD-dependent oxidoreductase